MSMFLPGTGAELRVHVEGIAARHPTVGLAVVLVRAGRPPAFRAFGLADICSRTPVDERTVFRIASITKTFTAVAIMQLCEQGLIDLDAPAADYLRAYRLIPARPGHRPPTVRQLLTHTAGLPQMLHATRAFEPVLGETVPRGADVPTLAEFYRGGLRLIAEPGVRHTYTNHGYATLGQIVEDVSGFALRTYFRAHIFGPLEMVDTDTVRSAPIAARLATGYALKKNGAAPVDDRDVILTGAGGIYSTPADMARFATALIAGKTVGPAEIVRPETLDAMFAPSYQPDARIPGVGLGFFRHHIAGHSVVGHDGLLPGFVSQMLLAPNDGAALVAFTNGARGALTWLLSETSQALAIMLGPGGAASTAVAHHPEAWAGLCGRYAFRGSFRDAQKWLLTGARVLVRAGRLTLRLLTSAPGLRLNAALQPDDPDDPDVYAFALPRLGIESARAVFSHTVGVTSALHLDIGVALLSFDKTPGGRLR